ncbi:MAG: ribbon-helix-helix domain-containing protein [Flavobacteriaceae bacterium]
MTDALPGAPYGPVVKRSVTIAGHPTSISLEQPFWEALQQAATRSGRPLSELVAAIDKARGEANLSSAIRLYVLADLRTRAT